MWGRVYGVICGLCIRVCREIGGVSVHRGVGYGGKGYGMWDVGGVCVLQKGCEFMISLVYYLQNMSCAVGEWHCGSCVRVLCVC